MFIVLFVCDIAIQGYLTMDSLIYVTSFEPLKNKFYIISWPALENQTTLFPPQSCLELKK